MLLLFTTLLAASPMSVGNAALERKDWAQAEKSFREMVTADPKDYLAWRTLGVALDMLGRRPEAAKAYATSLDIKETPQALVNLGLWLDHPGKYEVARTMFERALALDPAYWRGWRALAVVEDEMGELPDALLAAQRAQQLEPSQVSVIELVKSLRGKLASSGVTEAALRHYRSGTAAAGAGQDQIAQDELQQALEAAPRFADAHYNLGVVLRRTGKRVEAEKEYRAAVAAFGGLKSANRADAQNNLADLLLETGGSPREARALVSEAVAVRGERASYLDTLARACDALKEAPCAREAFQKLLSKPGVVLPPAVRAHAAERLRALGN